MDHPSLYACQPICEEKSAWHAAGADWSKRAHAPKLADLEGSNDLPRALIEIRGVLHWSRNFLPPNPGLGGIEPRPAPEAHFALPSDHGEATPEAVHQPNHMVATSYC